MLMCPNEKLRSIFTSYLVYPALPMRSSKWETPADANAFVLGSQHDTFHPVVRSIQVGIGGSPLLEMSGGPDRHLTCAQPRAPREEIGDCAHQQTRKRALSSANDLRSKLTN